MNIQRMLKFIVILVSLSWFSAGCGSGGGGGGNGTPVLERVDVMPDFVAMPIDDSDGSGDASPGQQFFAQGKDAAGNVLNGPSFTWRIEGGAGGSRGAINASTGLYSPPATLPPDSNLSTVVATADNGVEGFASVNLLTGLNLSFRQGAFISGLGDPCSGALPLSNRSIAVQGQMVYAVWADSSSNGQNICFVSSSDQGISFSSPVAINSVTTGARENPQIAVSPQGDVYIVWHDRRQAGDLGNDFDVYFRKARKIPDGSFEFSNEIIVNDDAAADGSREHFSPTIAVDAMGHIYVVWEDPRDRSPDSDIYFAKGSVDSRGEVKFSKSFRVNLGLPTDLIDHGFPSVAADDDGGIYVVWISFNGNSFVYMAKGQEVSENDIQFESAVLVSDSQSIAPLFPSIAVDPFKNVFVAWEDFRNPNKIPNQGGDIYLAKGTVGGNGRMSFAANINVTDARWDQFFPSVAVDLGGQVYIAWEDDRHAVRDLSGNPLDDNWDVYFRKARVDENGILNFSQEIRVNKDAEVVAQNTPSVALDSAGRAFVVWVDQFCPLGECLAFSMGQ